jgi:NAD(P)H-nitrite reductase large subunit
MSEDDSELICICMSVSRGEIKDAVLKGTHTLDGLKGNLQCCTGCGTCEDRVKKVLADALKTAPKPQPKPAAR